MQRHSDVARRRRRRVSIFPVITRIKPSSGLSSRPIDRIREQCSAQLICARRVLQYRRRGLVLWLPQDFGDNVFNPFFVIDGVAAFLDAGSGVHIALANDQKADDFAVQTVHALADIHHGLAFVGERRGRMGIRFYRRHNQSAF